MHAPVCVKSGALRVTHYSSFPHQSTSSSPCLIPPFLPSLASLPPPPPTPHTHPISLTLSVFNLTSSFFVFSLLCYFLVSLLSPISLSSPLLLPCISSLSFLPSPLLPILYSTSPSLSHSIRFYSLVSPLSPLFFYPSPISPLSFPSALFISPLSTFPSSLLRLPSLLLSFPIYPLSSPLFPPLPLSHFYSLPSLPSSLKRCTPLLSPRTNKQTHKQTSNKEGFETKGRFVCLYLYKAQYIRII